MIIHPPLVYDAFRTLVDSGEALTRTVADLSGAFHRLAATYRAIVKRPRKLKKAITKLQRYERLTPKERRRVTAYLAWANLRLDDVLKEIR